MHGFCTDFARFQNVQRVLFDAKFDKECGKFKAKNYAVSIENCGKSKLPEIETNLRLALNQWAQGSSPWRCTTTTKSELFSDRRRVRIFCFLRKAK